MDITKENVDLTRVYQIPANDPDLGCDGNEVFLKKNKLNRAINDAHVAEIRSAITKDNWTLFAPIEVNINTGAILDGQHRWKAFTSLDDSLKNDVCLQIRFYDIPENEEIDVIRAKNTNNKNWTIKAFVDSNKRAGNCKEINILYDFCDTHERCHKVKKNGKTGSRNLGYGAAFLWGYTPNRSLKTGKFTGSDALSQRRVEAADKMYKEVDKIIDALGYTTTTTWYERLAQAWFEINRDDECRDKLNDIGMLTVCSNISENKIGQPTSNKNEWFDYLKNIGLQLS